MKLNSNTIIDIALREDAVGTDVTTDVLIPQTHRSVAYIIAKEKTVLSGTDLASQIYKRIDPKLKIKIRYKDGKEVSANTKLIEISGSTRSILRGERITLNFLAHLSGIATLTAAFVQKAKSTKARILDTRKTLPGLRALEKYAVRCGGGTNHRLNLNEMVMIKDNHISAMKKNMSLGQMIRSVQKKHKAVEVEVTSLKEFRQALKAGPDIILLDNMKPSCMKDAVTYLRRQRLNKEVLLEASGGITLKNIKKIAQTGVDRISIGALTHSARAVNMSLELKPL